MTTHSELINAIANYDLPLVKQLANRAIINESNTQMEGKSLFHVFCSFLFNNTYRKPKQQLICEQMYDYFISIGANINQTDNEGNSIFLTLIQSNINDKSYSVLTKIIDNKSLDINKTNHLGHNAIQLCLQYSNNDILSDLIERGCNVDYKINDILEFCCNKRCENEFLLFINQPKINIDSVINIADNDNNTLLMKAIKSNSALIIKFLIEHHADPLIKNNKGENVNDFIRNSFLPDEIKKVVEWHYLNYKLNNNQSKIKSNKL